MQAKKPTATKTELKCPRCGRTWQDNGTTIPTHGPDPDGRFICSGTASKGMVKAGSFKV